MDYDKLLSPGKPAFYIVMTHPSPFADLYLQLMSRYSGAAIRMIRGQKSTTVPGFFDEVAAALQFPYYFGENWDAFEECMTDLSWIDGNAFLLMVSDANLLLHNADSKDLRLLMEILSNAHETWLTQTQDVEGDQLPTPFHVVFACSEVDVSAFLQRLTHAGVEFEVL